MYLRKSVAIFPNNLNSFDKPKYSYILKYFKISYSLSLKWMWFSRHSLKRYTDVLCISVQSKWCSGLQRTVLKAIRCFALALIIFISVYWGWPLSRDSNEDPTGPRLASLVNNYRRLSKTPLQMLAHGLEGGQGAGAGSWKMGVGS